jgi:hypothetical protein
LLSDGITQAPEAFCIFLLRIIENMLRIIAGAIIGSADLTHIRTTVVKFWKLEFG